MPSKKKSNFSSNSSTSNPSPHSELLFVNGSQKETLSEAQLAFNRALEALERARKQQDKERARLNRDLKYCVEELMPLLERICQTEFQILSCTIEARETLKLTPKRKRWLGDLIRIKADCLIEDPIGLDESQMLQLETWLNQIPPAYSKSQLQKLHFEEFEELREEINEMANEAGIEMNWDDIDPSFDPEQLQQILTERLLGIEEEFRKRDHAKASKQTRKSKPTKAQIERERIRQEVEKAKTRDFKSLYKQLAKVLHPDLETDPVLKLRKEDWMKRLTQARANSDLRDMLSIEMEWLGQESSHLSTASDEKLRIYAMVLKEQLTELREQTRNLIFETEYFPLHRFVDPHMDRMPIRFIKTDLKQDVQRTQNLIQALQAGGKEVQSLLNHWADEHALHCGE